MCILLEVVCLLIAGLYGQSNGREIVQVNLINPADIFALPSPGSEPDFLWNVSAPTGSKILLRCPQLSLPKDDSCSSGSLTIDVGVYKRKLCDDKSDYEVQSTGPQLTLRLQRKQGVTGRFECTVQLSRTDPAPFSHGTQVRTVNKIVVHPSSDETERFGLVELTEDIQFNPYVGPICLYNIANPFTGEKLRAFGYDDKKEGILPHTPTVKVFDTPLLRDTDLEAKPFSPKTLLTEQFQYAMLVGYPLLYFDAEAGGYLQVGIQVRQSLTDKKPYKPFYINADVRPLFPLIKKTLQELSPQHKTCDT